jgi:hypothetical protein
VSEFVLIYHPNGAMEKVPVCRCPCISGSENIHREWCYWFKKPKPITLPPDALRDSIRDMIADALLERDRENERKWAKINSAPNVYVRAEETTSLRDQFAMAAMSGIISTAFGEGATEKALTDLAYRLADAMMEARKPK